MTPTFAAPRLLLLVATALLAAGCARDGGLKAVERRRVAWYFEDVAHGLERDPKELVTDGMSPPMARLAIFARGSGGLAGGSTHPEPFDRRRGRWMLLRRALADGQVGYDRNGQLHLVRDMDPEIRAILAPAVLDENVDRLFGAGVLLRASGLRADSPAADELITLIQQAQRHHAHSVGGTPWSGDSTSGSGSAATPSTSARGSWPLPGG